MFAGVDYLLNGNRPQLYRCLSSCYNIYIICNPPWSFFFKIFFVWIYISIADESQCETAKCILKSNSPQITLRNNVKYLFLISGRYFSVTAWRFSEIISFGNKRTGKINKSQHALLFLVTFFVMSRGFLIFQLNFTFSQNK